MSTQTDALVATFPDFREVDAAIQKLNDCNMAMKQFSVISKYNFEKAPGLCAMVGVDLIAINSNRAVIWRDLWGVFFGGMLMNIPSVGPVAVIGHLADVVFADGGIAVGRLGMFGSVLHRIGLPERSVEHYEGALKVGAALILAHGPAAEMAHALTIIRATGPINVDLHQGLPAMDAVPDAPF